MNTCYNRWILLFFVILPITGWSQKPRLIQQKVDYKDSPIISNAGRFRSYSIVINTNDPFAKNYFKDPGRITNLKFKTIKYETNAANAGITLTLNIGDFKVGKKEVKKTVVVVDSVEQQLYAHHIQYTYPIEYLLTSKAGDQLFRKTYFNKGDFQTKTFNSPDESVDYYNTNKSILAKSMKKEAVTRTLNQFKSDKEYLISGRQIKKEINIYYIRSSKKVDFSSYEEHAKKTGNAFNKLNETSDIKQFAQLLKESLAFWDVSAKSANPDDKNHNWIVPVCYYNLGLCNLYLNQLKEADYYTSEVDISKKINLYLSQILFDSLKNEIDRKKSLYDAVPHKEEKAEIGKTEIVKTEEKLTEPLPDDFYTNGLDKSQALITDFSLDEAERTATDVKRKAEPFQSTARYGLEAKLLLADIKIKMGQVSEAAALFMQALETGGKIGMSDFLKFKTLTDLASLEINLSRHESVLNHLEEASSIAGEDIERRAIVDQCMGQYSAAIGQYHEALDYYGQSLVGYRKLKGDYTGQLIELYELLGITYYELGDYKKARSNFLKAYSQKKKKYGEENSYIADSYILLANSYDKMAQDLRKKLRQKKFTAIEEDSTALDYLNKAKSLRLELLSRKDPTLMNSSFYMPDFFNLEIQSMKLKYSFTLSDLTSNSSLQRELDQNISESISYYETLISHTENLFGINHPSLVYYYNELSEVNALFYYKTTSEWKKTARGALGKMERFASLLAEEKDKKSDMEIRVENFYAQEKYREQALKDLTRSLEILQNCYGEHHTEVSKQHLQIARFYQEVITLYYEFVAHFNQNMISAEKVIDEYQIEDQNDQENYDALIVRYNNLLSYFKSSYRDLLIFDELRLKHYQKAFLAVISDSSKEAVIVGNVLRHIKTMDIGQYINSPETFRNILYTKCHYNKPMYKDLSIDVMYDVFTWAAVDNEDVTTYGNDRRDALTGINNEYLHLDKLEKNMGSISDYDQLIDIMIQGYINEDDQFALAHRTKYHRLIAVDQILGNRRRYTARTSETRLDQLDEAFYYIEKTKALVLMSSMSESEAIINTQIPAELVQQEQELQHKIRMTNRDIVITNSQESKNELRRLKSELRDLKNQLAKTYPRYNKSRYSLDIAGLSEIKETLDDRTALISYSTSPDNMIIFTITSAKIEYKVINLTDDEIIKQVKAFRNSILYRSDEALVDSGKELFDKLIPKLNKEIDKLIIIPDGELATIPFEALLSEKVPKRELGTYVNYPFMILNYQISYAFSGTLYLQNQKGEQYSESNKFLGFAPVFSDGSEEGIVRSSTLDAMQSSGELDENRTRGVLRNGKYINPIPSTETEVNSLYDLFDQKGFSAKVFTHDRASESTLKTEDLNQYKFIHFATHGMVNEKHPELSGLLFAQTTDQDDDGMLYSGEIYNLDINADLVSLSACETGLGKVVTGEGVVGLSRAFTYAGTKNLLVSYWKVSDESTSILMQDFYRNALDSETKMTYGAALRTAKLNMINKGTYIHPYYWSPFVIIGN